MSDGKMERLVEQRPTAVFPPSFCPSLKTADYPRGQLRSKNSSCYLPRLNYTVATVLGISHFLFYCLFTINQENECYYLLLIDGENIT